MTRTDMIRTKMIENGKRLFQSAENLRSPDLNNMHDALLEDLTSGEFFLLKNLKSGEFFEEVREAGDESNDRDLYVSTSYIRNADILYKPARARKPRRLGTISVMLRLCNSGDVGGEKCDEKCNWPWVNQACLIMGWNREEDCDYYWKIADFEPTDDNLKSIHHAGNGLWRWQDQDDDEVKSYFFALPVFALTDADTLKRFALKPVKALFDEAEPESIAQDELGQVPVLYPGE